MLLIAKMALGMAGMTAVAGAYTFHEGLVSVNVRQYKGDSHHIQVWAPAAVVPVAMHFVPKRYLEQAIRQAGPFMPTVRAAMKALEDYPEARLVEVRDDQQYVSVHTHGGKILVDVSTPDEEVHVACPLVMIQDVSRQFEQDSPRL